MSIILQQHYSHESQLMETSSTLLCKLKVSNSKSMIDKSDSSSRSFLHVLSDISSSYLKEEENVYIHPLSQRSNSSKLKLLKEKSLQLCTENLGSETGIADIIMDSNSLIQCLDSMENPTGFIRQQQVVEKDSRKKMNNNSSRKSQFPPPLTTLSGEKTIRVTTHRESGRLVIKAVAATTLNQSCFQAQRSHGRLRLCYLNYEAVDSDLKVKRPNENDYNNNGDELENDDESHNQEEDDDNKVNCNQMNKEKGEIENEIEVEFEKEKFQKVGTCKEGEHGNNGLCNWESLRVAISSTFCF